MCHVARLIPSRAGEFWLNAADGDARNESTQPSGASHGQRNIIQIPESYTCLIYGRRALNCVERGLPH